MKTVAHVAVAALLAAGLFAAVAGVVGCGSGPENAAPATSVGVAIKITPLRFSSWNFAPGLSGKMTLQVTISNNTGGDIYLLDSPSLPGMDATTSSLTLHFDVEDHPPGADANVNVFPIPPQVPVRNGESATRTVEVSNPLQISNWLQIHWDTGTIPPTLLRKAPSVTLGAQLAISAVVGFGRTPFEYTSTTVPQDARLAFLAWQQRATSEAITIEP